MHFMIFKSDKNNQWYWSLNADNQKVVATSPGGYINKQGALHGIALVQANAPSASVYDKSQKAWL
jgi:uncharacterized protein YegP (UPF0339 family)